MVTTFRPGSLANSLLFSTARIVTKSGNATASGTAFLYSHTLPNEPIKGRGVPFLVTNRHVVATAEEGRVVFLRAADKQRLTGISSSPYPLTIGDFSKGWIYHPDPTVDLAMMDLSVFFQMIYEAHGVNLFIRASTAQDIPTGEALQNIDAIEDVFMIGYPNSIMDEVNHLPIVRRGITATPFSSNYQGREEFLIDASVFPGSSGSPVFLLDHQKPDADRSKRLYLLGILSGGFFRVHQSREMVRGDIPTSLSVDEHREMLDLGVVVKSNRIHQLIALWEQKIAASSYTPGQDNEEQARITDQNVSLLILELQKELRIRSWEELHDVLRSTFAWHLLTKFKTSGLDPGERLCLYRLLRSHRKCAELER